MKRTPVHTLLFIHRLPENRVNPMTHHTPLALPNELAH
jgi:hypothetical protein